MHLVECPAMPAPIRTQMWNARRAIWDQTRSEGPWLFHGTVCREYVLCLHWPNQKQDVVTCLLTAVRDLFVAYRHSVPEAVRRGLYCGSSSIVL